ncbi:MAG: Rieske 2Fe-2S domain-containing protein [Streptosporangiales bacterium]|nr:Rieske 2Fe-2S domain-containing protein [Streptosporangiales bacterium]
MAHQGGPLCLGRVYPWLTSEGPGDFGTAGEAALLACPWHGWEYDLATGQSFLGPGEVPVRSYDVAVEPGSSLGEHLEAGDAHDGRDARGGRIPGPYVAETFPVHVEEDYVVVETSRS